MYLGKNQTICFLAYIPLKKRGSYYLCCIYNYVFCQIEPRCQ